MRTTTLWITLALLLLASCRSVSATPEKVDPTPNRVTPVIVTPTPEKMNAEELEQAKQDIYRVVASRACGSGVVYIYPEIARSPLYGSEIELISPQLPEASAETWASYLLVNDPNLPIAIFSDFPINCQYEFVSPTHVVCAGPETDCIIPYGFSEIGFNKAGTQALVHVYTDCRECGGAGSIHLLEKKGGVWTIINTVALWIS